MWLSPKSPDPLFKGEISEGKVRGKCRKQAKRVMEEKYRSLGIQAANRKLQRKKPFSFSECCSQLPKAPSLL